MWRLACLTAISLPVLACAGGNSSFQAPAPPSPLDASSPVADVVDRYQNSQETYASLRGEVVSQSIEGEFREAVWYERPGKWRSELSGELHDLGSLRTGHLRITNERDHFLILEPARRYCRVDLEDPGASSVSARIDSQIFGFPGGLDLSKATLETDESIAGRPALKLVIDPAIRHRYVWIDSVYGVVLAYDNDVETSAIKHSEFTSITYNEDLAEGHFEPEVSGYTERPCEEIVNY